MEDTYMEEAYRDWCFRHFQFKNADHEIRYFLQTPPQKPWLRRARRALNLSTLKVAQRMGITTYTKFEKSEQKGTITLNSLRKCAEAMGCELVYAIRPHEGVPFSRRIWDLTVPHIKYPPPHPTAMSSRVQAKVHEPEFRRIMGWVLNRKAPAQDLLVAGVSHPGKPC